MVASLIRLKLTLMRNSASGDRQTYAMTGATVGLGLAIALIWLGVQPARNPVAQRDLLSLAVGMWVLGWGIAPVWAGQPLLQARHFSMLGAPRLRLATGLLASNLVGIPGALTVVALTSVAAFGGREGWVSALFAVPVVALLVLLALLISRLAGHGFSRLSSTRTGAAVTGAITGAILVLTQAGWMILIVIETVRLTGFSDGVATMIRAFPSSWGILAVDAAGAGDGTLALAWMAALAGLVALMFGVWIAIVDAPRGRDHVILGPRRRSASPGRILPWLTPQTQTVVTRELAAWSRDPERIQALAGAAVFAVATAALPLVADSTVLLPWMGFLAVVILVAMTSNPFGKDGTALWLTMQIPGSVSAEVRGRQLAWSLVAAAMALPLTAVGWWWSGDPAIDGWALSGTALVVIAGAGVVVWLGIVALVPGPDPKVAKDDPLDHADVTAQSFASLGLVAVAASPLFAAMAIAWSDTTGALILAALGGSYAAVLWWVPGSAARARLEDRAPDLLLAMRSGSTRTTDEASGGVLGGLTSRQQTALWMCLVLGIIALVPQAIVPAAMKLSGEVERVWFLALYMPPEWQWPAIAAMACLAFGLFASAYALYRKARVQPGS